MLNSIRARATHISVLGVLRYLARPAQQHAPHRTISRAVSKSLPARPTGLMAPFSPRPPAARLLATRTACSKGTEGH